MAWTTPLDWVAGKMTAVNLNTHVRDNFLAIGGPWSSYSPTLAQGVSTNITKTVTHAKYLEIGNFGFCQVRLDITGAGTSGSAVTITTPWTMAETNLTIGSGTYIDTGTAFYRGGVQQLSSTTVTIVRDSASSGNGVGSSPAFAVANTDVFMASFFCELA